jgi:prepilin-type N-terminal cleavage/methylation domain-containing protein
MCRPRVQSKGRGVPPDTHFPPGARNAKKSAEFCLQTQLHRPAQRQTPSQTEGCERLSPRTAPAFSLIELLVVIAIIAILAGLLLPVLASAKAKGKQAACLNNFKQLALCYQMYSGDNDGRLVENFAETSGNTNSWVRGDMKYAPDATNSFRIRQSKLFSYGGNLELYRCPDDTAKTDGRLRVRSYSMNSWVGSRLMEQAPYASTKTGFRTFVKESEVVARGPTELWLIADEDAQTLDDGWFLVTMDDTKPFASFPATRHQRGYGLNFADGHAQLYKLRDANTQFANVGVGAGNRISPNNPDWIRLKQATTSQYTYFQ